MKIYIYSYINKINGHRYVGKTNNVERRKREHLSQAYNPNSHYYKTLWASKIRQYGYDNFDFEVIEVTDENHWIERERYWIAYYNTFHGAGYNTTAGGDSGDFEGILNEQDVIEIIQDLKNPKLSQGEIAVKFAISEALVSNINQGLRYRQDNCDYPIRKNYKTGLQDYSQLMMLLKTTTKSFKEIAQILGMSEASVKKINYGKMQYDPNVTYPIRPMSGVTQKAERVQNLLLTTDKTITEIAKECDVSTTTVFRINQGLTHKNSKFSYPLRK